MSGQSQLLQMSLDIFDIIHVLITTTICVINFYDLSAWDGCWSLVSIWRFIYEFLKVGPCCGKWEGWALSPWFKHSGWMMLVAQKDHPKFVSNHCVIKHFVASLCYFDYAPSLLQGCSSYRLCQISSLFAASGSPNPLPLQQVALIDIFPIIFD